MGTVKKYVSPGGKEGYLARDSWIDALGDRQYKKARFARNAARNLEECKAEARAWLAQREADRSRGVFFEPSRELFGSALDRWVTSLSPATRSWSTILAYRRAAKHRFDLVRSIALADLTTTHVRRLLASWQDAQLSSSSIQHAFIAMRGVFTEAIESGKLLRNPMVGVTNPTAKRSELAIWSPEQVELFLARDDPYRYAWALMFGCLLRVGELAALRWEDLNADGFLHVCRTWTRDANYRRTIGAMTKTDASDRLIPVPPWVLTLLAQERAQRRDDGGWICANGDQPLTSDSLSRHWRLAVAASGLPRLTAHGARHSGASNLIVAGVPVSVVQRILGHTDPAFTMRVYVHHDANDLRSALATLSGLYRGEISLQGAQAAPKVVPMVRNDQESRAK